MNNSNKTFAVFKPNHDTYLKLITKIFISISYCSKDPKEVIDIPKKQHLINIFSFSIFLIFKNTVLVRLYIKKRLTLLSKINPHHQILIKQSIISLDFKLMKIANTTNNT
ncbi:hypothetical protein fh0823_07560 [Francisella halioticida]|uniref:Transposase n=1 Tax=Francisella halioticida TaxID=549298 RepID=A0ABM6LZ66_9GAMM|nr:hypothetical protein CDV26_05340 [Francisella halioticida]BCD90617.1 hypothetical protein fh0823_07560 [Francisella halioticida]